MAGMKPIAMWNQTFYTSATTTIAATDNTGIIATPLVPASAKAAVFPMYFVAVGDNVGDETNTLTIAWYGDAAGNGGVIGTTTFDQLTAGNLTDLEVWPGDVSAFNAGRDMVPLFPYCKITYTIGGAAPSLGFVIYLSYVTWLDN